MKINYFKNCSKSAAPTWVRYRVTGKLHVELYLSHAKLGYEGGLQCCLLCFSLESYNFRVHGMHHRHEPFYLFLWFLDLGLLFYNRLHKHLHLILLHASSVLLGWHMVCRLILVPVAAIALSNCIRNLALMIVAAWYLRWSWVGSVMKSQIWLMIMARTRNLWVSYHCI